MTKPEESTSPVIQLATIEQMSASSVRWMTDLGLATESFAHMMRKPTEERPFVYEARFDLLPAKGNNALVVLKGFGRDGALCAFSNANGFLQLLRGAEGHMRAGKLKWYVDQYPARNYSLREERYLAGEFYRV